MVRQKILVVDDEPLIRWTLSEALRTWGYQPIEAETGAQALDDLTVDQPVAVLLDINLPDSYGLDLLREIKRRQPQTIVIMVSADPITKQQFQHCEAEHRISSANQSTSKNYAWPYITALSKQASTSTRLWSVNHESWF